jgi:ergothioneine biosynthesis protein EgtB
MLAEPKTASGRLAERLGDARQRTDDLFAIVQSDSLYERPIPERHRIVFYIGHLEAFDWNLLRERVLDHRAFDPELDRLFAFGIDPVDGGLPTDKVSDWPSMEIVQRYVGRVRQQLDSALQKALSDDVSSDAHQLFNVAVEHRLMHAETLAYMLHQMPPDRKLAPSGRPEPIVAPFKPTMVEIPAGPISMGLRRSDIRSFGWDNEYEAHEVGVPAFAIDRYKVSNRQYLEFVDAGGYDEPLLWTAADWQWRKQQDISHPVFWRKSGNVWLYRTMFGEIPLPMDWPVYVSHAEAAAFARWAGKSLPTEEQWQRAAYGSNHHARTTAPDSLAGNFDFERWDPVSVASPHQTESFFGVAGMFGNGWEWTSSVFGPFPGFEAFSFYPGYSANFFDGQHYVMKGGSARTAACMMRPSFRNWFQSHYQYVYAGFRCVIN